MNTTDLTPLPAKPNLEQYRKQAKDLVKDWKAGSSDAVQRVKKYHPHADRLNSSFALTDAQLTIAREHGFESWPKFSGHLEELARSNSPISKFELAADAIIMGDAATLKALLHENPELIRARSTRVHRSMLLHYVGANGFENYRQKSPKNAVEILKILLDAGAEVDALADTYGKGTTLGLVATSVHPKQTGVQIELMDTLINAGASVDGAPSGWNPLVSALHNGRREAAEFLATRGANLDLEGAAGVGWLSTVQSFFNDDGSLKANATKSQMELGFLWACEYGRNDVVNFLLDRGVEITAQEKTGLTGLHWAVVGCQLETVQLLLRRGAPLELENIYGGTALGQAYWCAKNDQSGTDYKPIIEALIATGAKSD